MNIRFDGKLVVVSGAGHGIGRAISHSFADLGATVHACDISQANLAETGALGMKAAGSKLLKPFGSTPSASATSTASRPRARQTGKSSGRARQSAMPFWPSAWANSMAP